jgi:Ca2+-binding RTX toxin-like protein
MTTITVHNDSDFTFIGTFKLGGSDADVLVGTADADIIAGGKGGDIVEGGLGDDLLVGGELRLLERGANAGEYQADAAGADTFVFNFALSHETPTTYYFRPNAAGTGGDTPNVNGNLSAWQNYMSQLADWRETMTAQYGADSNQAMTGEARYTVKKTVGTLGLFDNSFSVGGDGWKIDAHDGSDQILHWGSDDKLELKGLAVLDFASFDDLFDVSVNANHDTVLSWGGGSIAIDGMDIADVAGFWAAGTLGDWFA